MMLLALLLPVLCRAQGPKANAQSAAFQDSVPQTSFYLKDRRVIFQKVYTSKLPQKELSDKLFTLLNTTTGFRFDLDQPSAADFYGQLCNYRFDRERYGATIFNSPILLAIPINARVVVQVKDFKYRITVSEVVFTDYSVQGSLIEELLEKSVMEKGGSKFKIDKTSLKLANYLNTDFTSLFSLDRSALTSDF